MTSIVHRVIAVMMIAWLGVASTPATAASPATNYQGLWWNPQESGWGINFAHQGDIIFATWFTYDTQGKPWWLIAELHKFAEGIYSGSVSTVRGPPLGTVPFAPAPVETEVGTMTVTFADATHATLAYTVNGISQTRQITPQVFGPQPTCAWGAQPDLALATHYQDLWWNPQESGWGVNFTHQGDVIFATWFTYDTQGKPWWLIALLDKTTGGAYTGPVWTVTGPPFDAVPWSATVETTVGTATATFTDGNSATFNYTVSGVTQSKAITRQVFVAPGTVCRPPLTPRTLAFVAGPVGIVSDPTIRPTAPSGAASSIDVSLPVTLRADGRPDIFGCHTADQDVLKFPCRFLRPEADGTLIDITRQLLGNGPLPSLNKVTEIILGDFNRDGRPDIFVAATGFDLPPFPGETNLLLISNPNGTYADRSSTLPQSLAFSHGASTADINGDGFLDIYVNNLHSAAGTVPYFLMGNGDGTFAQSHAGLPASLLSRHDSFDACQFADIDGDGFPDLVLGTNASSASGASVVLYNDGAGDFTRRPRYHLPANPLAGIPGQTPVTLGIVALDINRDGRMDLALMHSANPSYRSFALQALIQQTDGSFVDESAFRFPPEAVRTSEHFCRFLRTVDFNGDGWEDLHCDVATFTAEHPRYWLNNGDSTWSAVIPDPLNGLSAMAVHPVDFDSDGRTDLVALYTQVNGDVGYGSFFGTAARTAPTPPSIGSAVAGNAQIAVAFAASKLPGAAPISNYRATCKGRGGVPAATASGSASPIVVSGLVNFASYACNVTATNGIATSLPSADSNRVTPQGTLTVAVSGTGASTLGSSVTFSATLSGGASPTGSVTFKDSYAAPIAGCAHRPLSGATATCTTSALTYGPHTISALYSGNAGNPAALSPGLAHVVNAGVLGLANPVFIPTVAAGSVIFVYPTIRNVGTLALAVTGLSFTGPFSLSNNPCGPTLAAGAACTIEVRYAPTAVSAQIAGTMQVTHTGANSPFTVDLFGVTSALSQPILSASFNPPSVAAGSANATLTLTLGNPNGVPLTNVDIYFNLPGGMLTAAVPNPTSTCSAGTWGPASYLGGGPLAGRTAAEFSGGTVAANTTCVISIAVTHTGGAGTRTVSAFPFNASELTSAFAPVSLIVTPIQASAASAAGLAPP